MINAEQMNEQLQWFLVAFNKKHRIKLSFAFKTIQDALDDNVTIEQVYSFLKKNDYRYVEMDSEIKVISMDISKKDTYEDLEDIDFLLSQKIEIKVENNNEIVVQKSEASYRMNNYLIEEYSSSNNQSAKQQLIINNIGLINKMINKYQNYMSHSLTEEDLRHEGVFGLSSAIDRFKFNEGASFSTYAGYWIRQAIIRSMMNIGTIVRIPVHLSEQIRKIKKLESRINSEIEDIEEKHKVLLAEAEITEERYQLLKLVEHQFLSFTSLNQYLHTEDGGGDTELIDFVPNDRLEVFVTYAKEYKDPYELVEENILRNNLDRLLDYLTDREKGILSLRYGLDNGGEGKTLEEIGKLYGLTRERVRQLEARALKKLTTFAHKEKCLWIPEGATS